VKLFRQVGLLILLAAVVAAGLRAWQPAGLDWSGSALRPGEITLAQAQAFARNRVVLWVDARSARAFAAGHVPDAVNLKLADWETDFPGLMKVWQPESVLVVYCDDRACGASTAVAERLRAAGLPEVYVLSGGWVAAKAELENGQWRASK